MIKTEQTNVSQRESLRQSIDAYQLSQCIIVAARLGIADLLKDGPRHYQDLAATSGAEPGPLFRLLRALVSAGIFERLPDGQFALNEASEYLRKDIPGSLHAWAILAGDQPYPAWGELLHSLQTGEPAFNHLHGMSNWQYRRQNPPAAKVFNDAMSENADTSTAAIIQLVDFSRFARVVDLGGGQGALLAGILKANPSVHGTLIDLEPVVQGARKSLQEAGVSERCEIIAGSFLEGIPGGGDVYIFKDVLLDWDDDEAARILKNCRKAMKAGQSLLIIEGIIPSEQPTLDAAMVDMRMMVMSGGRGRTCEEFQTLLQDAGFELARVIPTPWFYQILEAKPL